MDLSNLGLNDLRALEQKVKLEIKRREHEDMARAREQILAIAQSVGIPLKDLIGTGMRVKASGNNVGAPRGTVAVRFRHPEDANLQWTGRGRQPKWIVEWVANGKSLEELRVN